MRERIRIWGDSLLKGVVFDELRNRYTILKDNCISKLKGMLPFPVENYSRMGCTAAQALDLVKNEPLTGGGLALIEFGGNDCDMDWPAVAANPKADHQPKTPPARFAAQLEDLVARTRAAGMEPMLAVPTPLFAPRYFNWVTRGLDSAAVLAFLGDVQRIYRWQELYAFAALRTAAALNCSILDLRTPFLERKHYENLLCIDGIHPNADGHALMLETIKTALC
ncbi:MAG: SGNH/GDSL hydrolase family protein [Clostridia bacterium]|nr:SGNH/GDSL hydrolase family protein [Clostridia bacterium]